MKGKKRVFIHFAFAGLKDDVTAQTKAVISKILDRKRLKFSINPEFIPVFQPHLHPKFKGKKVGQIGNPPHYKHYGRFGIVLSDTFLKRKGIKKVHYYEESSLFTDSLITNWNLKYAYKPNLNAAERSKKHDLETQILAFRKPATLFESFRESRLLALKKAAGQME